MGDKALRKRQASWKQPLVEAQRQRLDPWRTLLRASINWEETRMHCGSRRMKDQNALPLDDMEFRINARVRLDLPVIQKGL